jgi:hypothetical protein
MATVASFVSFTESSIAKSTTPWPSSMRAPLTRPTSTPASFTESPLNTPVASENTADRWYWCWKNSRLPIFMASTAVNTADTAMKARTLTRVAFENREERAITAPPGGRVHPSAVSADSADPEVAAGRSPRRCTGAPSAGRRPGELCRSASGSPRRSCRR